MAVRSKRFEYTVSVDEGGVMYADGRAPTATPAEWTPDHLVLAAVVRCSLESLRHHARRGEMELRGGGTARGTVARRDGDGRFALVEVGVDLDVELDPAPGPDLPELLAQAERDCFVGASLRAAPSYAWTVNGARRAPAPALGAPAAGAAAA